MTRYNFNKHVVLFIRKIGERRGILKVREATTTMDNLLPKKLVMQPNDKFIFRKVFSAYFGSRDK